MKKWPSTLIIISIVGNSIIPCLNAQKSSVTHRSIIFKTPAPEGTVNPCVLFLNNYLKTAKANTLKDSFGFPSKWGYRCFFHWAVWGYLSGDSKLKGDKQLLKMSAVWIDNFLAKINTPPADKEKLKNWKPGKINDDWFFFFYSTPLIEIEADKEAVDIIGKERLARYKKVINDNFYSQEVLDKLLKKYKNYTNMLFHQFPMQLANYLLNDNKSAYDFCIQTTNILAEQQMPNGAFPYRYHLYGKKHSEADTMYYHSITIRGLYLLWWYTGSPEALAVLKKSIPFYPLILEPPYHFSSGADIWWKDQWRTFWPQHVAMVAAATKDGENATIALKMGGDRKSLDWFDPVVGAHAFRLMQEEKIKPVPVRNNYVIKDPDIRGIRSRWDSWSNIFTTGSYSFTRISAMNTDGKKFNAFHLGRPLYMAKPYTKMAAQINPGMFSTLGRYGAEFNSLIDGNLALTCTSYRLALDSMTWQSAQPEAPFMNDELWLMTKDGLCGMIFSTVEKDCEGFEFMHQYRFICKKFSGEKDNFVAGNINFKVWDSNFSNQLLERTRTYIYDTRRRNDYQIALTNSKRSPEEIIQNGEKDSKAVLPLKRKFTKGNIFYSLTSICPAGKRFKKAVLISKENVLAFSVVLNNVNYLAAYNRTDKNINWQLPESFNKSSIMTTWGKNVPSQKIINIPPKNGILIKK